MNKKLVLIIVSLIGTLSTVAQSILPVETGEFCPLQDITFTVTLPRIVDNTTPTVASWTNGPIVVSGINPNSVVNTQTQTTCTFVGRFRDVNINQVFKIDYVTSTNPSAIYLASFKKIKSLFYPNPVGSSSSSPCQQFRVNQISITAPLCQVTNIPISVIPTNWSTFGEGNDFCWGSITTYEYQLPNGWSIGSTTSTGSNWIVGNNSVTVTSDLSTGDGMTIFSSQCVPRSLYV
ncbi:MAG: hypothetical protein M0Q26_13010 [Chitinophagaceae bacterium]|nr:hypothetical protein [Chitinophagaceae bacterium]